MKLTKEQTNILIMLLDEEIKRERKFVIACEKSPLASLGEYNIKLYSQIKDKLQGDEE